MRIFLFIIIIAMPVCTLASFQDNTNYSAVMVENDSTSGEDTDSDNRKQLTTVRKVHTPEISRPLHQKNQLFADYIDNISRNKTILTTLVFARENILSSQLGYMRETFQQYRRNKFFLTHKSKLITAQALVFQDRIGEIKAAISYYAQIREYLSSENPIERFSGSIFLIVDSFRLFITKRAFAIEDLEFVTKFASDFIPPLVNYHPFIDPQILVAYYLTPPSKQNLHMQKFCTEFTINFFHQNLSYHIITSIIPQYFNNMQVNKFFNNKFLQNLNSFFAQADIPIMLQLGLQELINNVFLIKNLSKYPGISEPFWQTKTPENSFYDFFYSGCSINRRSRQTKQKKLNRALEAAQKKITPWQQPICKHKENFILRIGIQNFFDINSPYFLLEDNLLKEFSHYCRLQLIMQELLYIRQESNDDPIALDSAYLAIENLPEIKFNSDEYADHSNQSDSTSTEMDYYGYHYDDLNYCQSKQDGSVTAHDSYNLEQYIAIYLKKKLHSKLFNLLRSQGNTFKWDVFCTIFQSFPNTTISYASGGASQCKFYYRAPKNTKYRNLGLMHKPHPHIAFYKNNFCHAQKIFLNLFKCNGFTINNFMELDLTITANYQLQPDFNFDQES